MLILDKVKEMLADRNLSEVARRTGLSWPCVQGIADGTTTNPRYKTWKKLSDYLEGKYDRTN